MTDYSQDHEQAAILAAFEGRPPGRLLDIGAYHPTVFSNSRALIEAGWSGLLIEPSPGPMLALLAGYGNDPMITLVQAAVGIESGYIQMHITNDAVSTSSAGVHALWRDRTEYLGTMMVPVITLEQIGNQWGGFAFVNIDGEGMSADIFHRMLAINWRPRCVCVEYDDRLPELCSAATRAGYKLTFSNGTNAVFV